MTRCTIGVFAHNEADNVRRTLLALLAQQLRTVEIAEIIVVASGCTDATVERAKEVASGHPLIKLDVETTRTGKAAAIRRLTKMATGEVIVLVGADTLPAPTAIQHLVEPFADPTVGMTGARIIPLNSPTTWLGYSVQLLWHVHHQLAMRTPKLGELVAFRNVIEMPEDTSTDEPAIEALIAHQGYRLVYAPKAVVFNRGPVKFQEFMRQRRRVFAGQVRIAFRFRYLTSSLKIRHAIPLIVEAIRSYPQFVMWTVATMGVEFAARVMGMCDVLKGPEEVVWRPITTSKQISTVSSRADVTLVSVSWAPGSLDSNAFVRELQRLPDPLGSVFWWDGSRGEMLLQLSASAAPAEWIERHIRNVSRVVASSEASDASLVSCRLVTFQSVPAPAA